MQCSVAGQGQLGQQPLQEGPWEAHHTWSSERRGCSLHRLPACPQVRRCPGLGTGLSVCQLVVISQPGSCTALPWSPIHVPHPGQPLGLSPRGHLLHFRLHLLQVKQVALEQPLVSSCVSCWDDSWGHHRGSGGWQKSKGSAVPGLEAASGRKHFCPTPLHTAHGCYPV